ncbi:hypothetical protein ACO0K9_08395 [Undibacterium sp. Ji50W]|uniref:hypothetical protein n=1 Tax=Undibacterium sp. Ji50W TaxID=3413041 RepID=UPI003BF07834
MSDYTFVARQCHIKMVSLLITIFNIGKLPQVRLKKQDMHKSASAGKLRLISSLA